MKRSITVCLFIALVAGCSGNEGIPPSVDASTSDTSGGGAACTGAAYDPCTTNDECSSGNCHFYRMSNLTVCVSTCTPGDDSTCPVDSSGANGTCNNMGICKPAMPNSCTR